MNTRAGIPASALAQQKRPATSQRHRDRRGALPGTGTDGDPADPRVDPAGQGDEHGEQRRDQGEQQQNRTAAPDRHSSHAWSRPRRPRGRGRAGHRPDFRPRPRDSGSNIEPLMVLRALLVLALLGPASAAAQPRSLAPRPRRRKLDPAAALVEQLEAAAATGNAAAILALGVTPTVPGLQYFASIAAPAPTRVIIKERDRAALDLRASGC